MDEQSKNKLEALFQKDRAHAVKVQQARSAEEAAQEEFLHAYFIARDSVIMPAFRQFADQIASHGWSAEITNENGKPAQPKGVNGPHIPEQRPSVRAEFYRGDTKPRISPGRSLPNFMLYADRNAKQVVFYMSTIGITHGGAGQGAGTAKLEALTIDMLHMKMVDYFGKLLADARPR